MSALNSDLQAYLFQCVLKKSAMVQAMRCLDIYAIREPMPNQSATGPRFVRYLDPTLKALKKLGGSGRPSEVVDIVARFKQVPDSERQEIVQSGALRFDKEVAFARQYLVWAGYLDASKRGVWTLTEKGAASSGLSDKEAIQLFKEQYALHSFSKKKDETKENDESKQIEEREEEEEELFPSDEGYKVRLISILRSLPAEGFERLCQRILRESGFEKVEVTGKVGDGGIDGIGILKLNTFVAFNVLFQCKKYAGIVGPSQVRDFRGAMQGRAEKGIIMTTGTFSKAAREEATRDGVNPIEMVDGEQLIQLFEELQLGLTPRTTYDVDMGFFEQFGFNDASRSIDK